MIKVISGTNRRQNLTKIVSKEYVRFLKEMGEEASMLSLDEVNVSERDASFEMMEKELEPVEKFIIVMPEYHGSYPGILKLMIDNTDVSRVWHHKKVLLVGVATGRAGNLRGMEHLTGSLLHMKMLVHPNRLPISKVHELLDENGKFTDLPTIEVISRQLKEFIKF